MVFVIINSGMLIRNRFFLIDVVCVTAHQGCCRCYSFTALGGLVVVSIPIADDVCLER